MNAGPTRSAETTTERCRDIAHIGPIELVVPEFQASIRFYVDQLGLTEVERRGGHSYLHAWDDYGAVTLMLLQGRHPGVRRTFLRAAGPDALQRRVAAIEATGLGEGWTDQVAGQGPTYLFHGPDGHRLGIYWERDWYRPASGEEPALKNQAAKFPGRGANARRLDHINFLSGRVLDDCALLEDVLGAKRTEQIVDDEGLPQAVWFTISDKTYDLVANIDHTGSSGRLHHIAFATDTREDILRAADVCLEAGIHIETGPHKHAIQQTYFLYVWDPSGNRVELANAGARLMLAPDWQTISWTPAERARGQAWGLKTIESFHTHGTPAPGEVAG